MSFVDKIESWLTSRKVLILLLFIGFLVYGNSIPNGFVWDDEEQIVNNAIIQDLGNIAQIFSGATFSTGGAGLSGYFFRPLITFTFMMNYFIWGENAFGFHLFQVIFHILNGFLVFKLLLILTAGFKSSYRKSLAFGLAAIYTVHPAITEGVVYIAAVSEVMFSFFILLALNIFLKTQNTKPSFKKILAVCSLLFWATLYKEPAVIGPPILIAYLIIFKPKFVRPWLIALVITLSAYFFLRLAIVQTPITHPLYSNISEASLAQRLMTIPSVISHYLTIIFYPAKLAVSQHFVIKEFGIYNFFTPLLLILFILAGTVYTAWRTGNKLIFFALAWLVISLGPIINIIPLDMTVAERWLYFPFIGFLLLVFSLTLNLNSRRGGYFILIAVFLTLIPLSVRTIMRNMDWKDGLTLYSADAKINTNSFDLESNLGVELFRQGRLEEAKLNFEKSLSLQPKWHFALNNLGAVYQRQGNTEKAKEYYFKVLETSDYYLAHENLSSILTFEEDSEKARDFTEKSLQKLPNNSSLWLNLAISYYKLGDKEKALKAAETAYLINPNEQTAYVYSKILNDQELRFE